MRSYVATPGKYKESSTVCNSSHIVDRASFDVEANRRCYLSSHLGLLLRDRYLDVEIFPRELYWACPGPVILSCLAQDSVPVIV